MLEVEQEVYDLICERTSDDVDGVQDATGNIWTSRNRLKSDAVKSKYTYDKGNLNSILSSLLSSGKIINWHGLIAPATEEHIGLIIENERQSDIQRPLLIGHAERLKS